MNSTSAGVSVKNRISSSRPISGNPRSRSSSSLENTRVAIRAPTTHPNHSKAARTSLRGSR